MSYCLNCGKKNETAVCSCGFDQIKASQEQMMMKPIDAHPHFSSCPHCGGSIAHTAVAGGGGLYRIYEPGETRPGQWYLTPGGYTVFVPSTPNNPTAGPGGVPASSVPWASPPPPPAQKTDH